MQAHQSAAANSDEFVTEAFITLEQVSVLVHELVVAEVWADSVLPEVIAAAREIDDTTSADGNTSTVKPYLVVFHQATLANLLEILLFSQAAALSLTEEALIELADWCMRKLAWLNSAEASNHGPEVPVTSADELLAEDPWATLAKQAAKVQFDVAVISVTLLRYLSQYVTDLPVALSSRLMRVHDAPLSLVPLIHSPPWVTSAPVKTKKGKTKIKLHKYIDGSWRPLSSGDVALLSKTEIQVWLTLYNLLMEPSLRSAYAFNSSKNSVLTSLTGALTQPVLDQIPILAPFARFLHELTLSTPPAATATPPVMRNHVLSELGDQPALLAQAFVDAMIDDSPDTIAAYMSGLADTYSLDNLEDVLDPPRCVVCGDDAVNRCSRCKAEWYCGRECQVAAWKDHKPLCDLIASAVTPQ
ncbi:zinc finger MYND domain-containing protein 10 [Thecamonas trahens ATCC 50062]|uniref:Zinc finger MYND domain-containing protein 10 n=1 Tax=Thecamonas trahens ATCC 50062 TaxID=461836 RepID=A0A0L0DWL8_THETB|nr:zinc finger MYND domain-containing protein 10 [Thecamonas trahens ATCC 50062]KNC55928.1 zinc finger MYND domain-containing protein 10 [Thecamonas trahens ATCC 50062]|eukprot:XP_013752702.1 zinc finger MYND domain-containing protein 10 [Thecamonas trahens ATCC 50062]